MVFKCSECGADCVGVDEVASCGQCGSIFDLVNGRYVYSSPAGSRNTQMEQMAKIFYLKMADEALPQLYRSIADMKAGRLIPWDEAKKRMGIP